MDNESIAERRGHTDASLDAERADTDAAREVATGKARRALDDLVERDRLLADERLMKFRDGADRVRAQHRAKWAARDGSAATASEPTDEAIAAERESMDADRDQERQRDDAVIIEQRRRDDAPVRARAELQRHETNEQLSTERRSADAAIAALDEVKDALARSETEEERRWSLFQMVTHDLRSPLSVIALNAEFLGEGITDVPMREAAHDVICAAARMDRLLTDLLDVARIESKTLRIEKREHDVGALLTEVLRAYRPLFASRGMNLAVEVPTPSVVGSFDYDRVVQVLSNLLGNAMKFTAPTTTIFLHVERGPEELEFVLKDSGPGIHADHLPQLFKRFGQIDTDARRGLGLGLYICDQIVAAHGGRIWVKSELGKGATFRFTLPLSG